MRSNSIRFSSGVLTRSILAFCLLTAVFGRQAIADDDKIAKAGALLANDLKPHVITLDRDLKVYHYFNYAPLNLDLPLSSPKFDHVLTSAINYFWSDTNHEALYAADNPAATRYYGSILIEVTVQKGSHVLVGHLDYMQLSPDTMAAIKDVSPGAYYSAGSRFDCDIMTIPKPILAVALNILDVEVATYHFLFGDAAVCATKSESAFILFGTPANLAQAAQGTGVIAKHMTVNGYTPAAVDFSDPVKHEAYAKLDRFIKLSGREALNPISTAFEPSAMSDAEKTAWQNEIYTCQGIHPTDEPAH